MHIKSYRSSTTPLVITATEIKSPDAGSLVHASKAELVIFSFCNDAPTLGVAMACLQLDGKQSIKNYVSHMARSNFTTSY